MKVAVATITGKRQLTIPAKIFRALGLSVGERALVKEEEGQIKIAPVRSVVENLASSVEVPSEYKDLDIDALVREAKKDYFSRKSS